jgi:predicted nucleic acid-binding protein
LSVAAGYLLDTNLISETRKIRSDAGVMAFLGAADTVGLFLSVLTLGELRKGVETKRRTDAPVAARLEAWWTVSKRLSPIGFSRWTQPPGDFGASCLPTAACR